jgi:hypothetical protein
MVTRPSGLSLIFPGKDKLVAFENLARSLKASRSTIGSPNVNSSAAGYLYRLWRFNPHWDLLWSVPGYNPSARHHPISGEYVAWDGRSLSAPMFDSTAKLGSILADIDCSSADQSIAMTICIGLAELRGRFDSPTPFYRSDQIAPASFELQSPKCECIS